MDKQIASAILEIVYSLDTELGKLDTLVSQIADEATRTRYTQALGDLLGSLTKNFIFPLTDEFPDLDRDRNGE